MSLLVVKGQKNSLPVLQGTKKPGSVNLLRSLRIVVGSGLQQTPIEAHLCRIRGSLNGRSIRCPGALDSHRYHRYLADSKSGLQIAPVS
jgi:hypothetical protein